MFSIFVLDSFWGIDSIFYSAELDLYIDLFLIALAKEKLIWMEERPTILIIVDRANIW